jgi:hypothetical protein
MKTKLTLSIDEELVQFAHQQARRSSTSVSGMFSEFLMKRKLHADARPVPSVEQMAGSLKTYAIDDSKTAIRSAYATKYSD